MFVVTADQINSRQGVDAVRAIIASLSAELGAGLTLPPDRSAGDEVQLLTDDPPTVLRAVLLLTRTRRFSVGLGVGAVRRPLGDSIRESTGEAFIAARTAVGRAKSRPSRFAVEGAESAGDVEALVDLLLLLRGRRTEEGWQLYDLLVAGLTQAEAAKRLSITPQATSDRARAADLKAEFAATAPLTRLVARLGEEAP